MPEVIKNMNGLSVESTLRKEALSGLTNTVLKSTVTSLFGIPGVGKTMFLQQWRNETINSNSRLLPIFLNSSEYFTVNNDPNKKTVIIVDDPLLPLEEVEKIRTEYPEASFIIVTRETYKSEIFDSFPEWLSLLKNIYYLPPLSFVEHKQYLNSLITGTVFTLTKFQIDETYSLCGGHPVFTNLFIQNALKLSHGLNWENFKEQSLNFPNLLEVSKQIWKSLPEEERTLLLGAFKGIEAKKQDTTLLESLEKKGIIRRHGGNFQVFAKLFSNYIRKYGEMKILPDGIILEEKSRRCFRDGEEITHILSPNEYYLLEIFIKNQSRVLTREEVKSLLLKRKPGEPISDEALDQVVVRLRGKIEKDRHNPQKLLTIRGRGFQFRP